jgi:uncharacterized protein (TIGR03000 family)
MYTVVLMAALSTSPAATGFGLHGCHGYNVATNAYCHGCACAGCYGGYGSSAYGYGAYGYGSSFSIYAPPPCANVFGCTGCYGCYGGWSCYGVALPHHGYWHECTPVTPNPQPNLEETPAPKELKGKEQTRARVIIDAPADAKIYVDGNLVHAGKRAFYTPELDGEQKYFYDVRAEIVRDGHTYSDTRRIILGAGHSVSASFPNLGSEAATATSAGE